jgi:hypothetical protein
MALAREWEQLVDEVRRLEGFEDFLKPPRIEVLRAAAANGPVAVLNVSRWRCDALIVRADTDVQVVPLPNLDAETVVKQTQRYLDVLGDLQRHERGARRIDNTDDLGDFTEKMAAVEAGREATETALRSIMEWLWETVTEPVLKALDYLSDESLADRATLPRVWWCPTGPLTLLPIHGAGFHDPSQSATGRQVVSRVVSSYTPTLRVLQEAIVRPVTKDVPAHMLVVGVATAPGDEPLPQVGREVTFLTALFDGGCTVLSEESGHLPTREAVMDGLAGHPWVHFACHGYQNLKDPSRAGLRLSDGLLTLADLSATDRHGEFVYLAACNTATGGVDLPDEVITLTAAMHYAGFRHVIGTLWSVDDTVAADVTEAFYRKAGGEAFTPSRAATALHAAVAEVRAAKALPLTQWLPFTHTGP